MKMRLKRQHKKCFFCGGTIDMSAHLDHLVPIYRGGKSIKPNLFATCKDCNLTKGTDMLIVTNPETILFYQKLKHEYGKWVMKKRKGIFEEPNSYIWQYWIYRADLFKRIKHSPRVKLRNYPEIVF